MEVETGIREVLRVAVLFLVVVLAVADVMKVVSDSAVMVAVMKIRVTFEFVADQVVVLATTDLIELAVAARQTVLMAATGTGYDSCFDGSVCVFFCMWCFF